MQNPPSPVDAEKWGPQRGKWEPNFCASTVLSVVNAAVSLSHTQSPLATLQTCHCIGPMAAWGWTEASLCFQQAHRSLALGGVIVCHLPLFIEHLLCAGAPGVKTHHLGLGEGRTVGAQVDRAYRTPGLIPTLHGRHCQE